MNYNFQHIQFLFALLSIPVLGLLFYLLLRWKASASKRLGDPKLVQLLTANYSPTAFALKFGLALAALATIILAAANIRQPGAMDPVQRRGVDVMIALDVSKSMLAEDPRPSRLDRAKQFITRLVNNLPDDRVGLILFAGRAYMQMPLSTDHNAAIMFVQGASPEAVPSQGTMISEPLRMSLSAFNSKERKFKAVVLITDGEDHDPQTAALTQELTANGVMVNTIGIGSPEGSIIPDPLSNGPKKDEHGNTIVSKLNEAALQQLAAQTKGVYVRLNDPAEAVTKVKQQLSTIEATALEDLAFRDYKTYFQWFIAAAILLLLVEFFLSERKWKLA